MTAENEEFVGVKMSRENSDNT